MKQYKRAIDVKTGTGWVKLEARDSEDMWHAYNLISIGDRVTATTTRKVKNETGSGSTESERVRITLTLQVKTIDFDSLAAGLRLTGQNVRENEHVRAGAFHTLELAENRAFTIEKDAWDSVDLERLETSLNPAKDADIVVLLMQEGLANLLLLSRSLTVTLSRIETSIPKKGKSAIFGREAATTKFFDAVVRSIEQHLDLRKLKVMVIASPGFVKDEFYKHLLLEASRNDLRSITESKAKIVLHHASSGHRHAIDELLAHPDLQSRLSDAKAVQEVKALTSFNDMLARDPDRAFYGPSHVLAAAESGAVDKLLVTDDLFRSEKVEVRKRYVALVETVQGIGGDVHVFSTQHESGKQLKDMSGIAAVLRFPMPQLNDLEPPADEDDDDNNEAA